MRLAHIKHQNLELLYDCLSDEQKERLEAFFEADSKVDGIIDFHRFRYAFHLGAQLMAELIEGKAELLRSSAQA